MKNNSKKLRNVIEISEAKIQGHLDERIRESVEETLNKMLDAEADLLCNAKRYERSEARNSTRAGHYPLHDRCPKYSLVIGHEIDMTPKTSITWRRFRSARPPRSGPGS